MIELLDGELSNDKLIELFDNDFRGARELHDEQIERIQKWVDEYEGEPYGNEVKGRSSIVWKLAKKQGVTLASNMIKPFITQNEIASFTPRTYRDVVKAKLYSKVVNHFWDSEFDSNRFLKQLATLMVKEGTAFVRVGWENDDRTEVENIPLVTPEMLLWFAENKKDVEPQPDGSYNVITKNILVNKPTAKIVRNEDVFLDPTADSFEEVKFLIYQYTTTIHDMKMQPHLYDEKAVKKLESLLLTEDDRRYDSIFVQRNQDEISDDIGGDNPTEFEFIDKTRRKIKVYEYWGWYDIDDCGKDEPIVATFGRFGEKTILLKMKKNPFPFAEIPFICFPLYDVEFSPYGRSIVDLVSDEQKVTTAMVRGIIDNMALSNNGVKFFKKGALDALNFRRLREGEPYVEINTTDSVNTAILDGSFNQLPQSIFNFWDVINIQAETTTGITRNIQGAVSPSELRSSTSNYSAMMTQSQIRLLDITNNLTNGLKKLIYFWTVMALEYLSEDEVQDITGDNIAELKVAETKKFQAQFGLIDEQGQPTVDQETFDKAMVLIIKEVSDMFDKDDFKFDVSINVGTDGLKQIKTQQINMFLQQASGLAEVGAVPPEVIKLLVAELAEQMDMQKIARDIREYQPQPDPMQQQMMELELAHKQAQVEKDSALAKNALARTENVGVKTQKEALATDADIANKYADVKKKLADVELGKADRMIKAKDTEIKAKQANKKDSEKPKKK